MMLFKFYHHDKIMHISCHDKIMHVSWQDRAYVVKHKYMYKLMSKDESFKY